MMFDVNCIHELASGNLSENGYKSIVRSIAILVRNSHWQKSIIVSENPNSDYWTSDDIKELVQQFFEWTLKKEKLNALSIIPDDCLSNYFTQIFISFVSNRITEEQQKTGLSYKKCQELVFEISKDKHFSKIINGKHYVSYYPFEDEDISIDFDLINILEFLSPFKIPEETKHYKPLVTIALEEILCLFGRPIEISKLIKITFNLFDQRFFVFFPEEETIQEEPSEGNIEKHQKVIQEILAGLSKKDALIISEYLFQSCGEVSLSDLKDKYQLPKRTIHYKIESFKKKISKFYSPENEDEDIIFMIKLSFSLNELAK